MRQLRRILVSVFGYIFPRSCLPTFFKACRQLPKRRSSCILVDVFGNISSIFPTAFSNARRQLPKLFAYSNFTGDVRPRVWFTMFCYGHNVWLSLAHRGLSGTTFISLYVCSVSSVVFTIDVIHRYFNARTRAYYLAAISLVGLYIFNLQKFITLLQITINHVQ